MAALPEHVIDCDVRPFVPEVGWSVEEHRKGGQLDWTTARVVLYLADAQIAAAGFGIEGNHLRLHLRNKPVLNANVLDYLFEYQLLIPRQWRDLTGPDRHNTSIYFWGTVYKTSDQLLVVRDLTWTENKWYMHWRWLGFQWDAATPAALLIL